MQSNAVSHSVPASSANFESIDPSTSSGAPSAALANLVVASIIGPSRFPLADAGPLLQRSHPPLPPLASVFPLSKTRLPQAVNESTLVAATLKAFRPKIDLFGQPAMTKRILT